jgi:bleomycin hydrolase
MKTTFLLTMMMFLSLDLFSQKKDFETVVRNPATEVKNQMESGQYCWCYATCSFLESELIRSGKGVFDLSEDYFIYQAYIDKAVNYTLRKGMTSFRRGGLSNDVFRIIKEKGIVPDPFYKIDYIRNNHEPEDVLEAYLNTILKEEYLTENWMKHYRALLDSYFSDRFDQFKYDGTTFTPPDFSKYLQLNVDNYVSLTSFTHHPFHSEFVLELRDNYAGAPSFNLPLNKFLQAIDTCLLKGFTLVWDGCLDGDSFSYDKGLAMIPDSDGKIPELNPSIDEKIVDQQKRQIAFERLQTTDDHLMHIVGIAKNKQGKKFYIIKDSGGEYGPFKGYLYMSENYLLMNTISVTLNKNSLPGTVKMIIN